MSSYTSYVLTDSGEYLRSTVGEATPLPPAVQLQTRWDNVSVSGQEEGYTVIIRTVYHFNSHKPNNSLISLIEN